MKLKDALVGFLFWIGILVFSFVVSALDSLPMWALFILAALSWTAYILVVIRDHKREKRYAKQPEFFVRTPNGKVIPLSDIPNPQPIYDQEEDN